MDHSSILEIKQYISLPEELCQNLSTRKYKRKKGIKFLLDLAEIHELHVMIQTFLCSFSSSFLSKFAFLNTISLLQHHLLQRHLDICVLADFMLRWKTVSSQLKHYSVRFCYTLSNNKCNVGNDRVNCRASICSLDFLGCKSWFQAVSQHQDGPYFMLVCFL